MSINIKQNSNEIKQNIQDLKCVMFSGINNNWKTLLDNNELDEIINYLLDKYDNLDENIITPKICNWFEFAKYVDHPNKIKIVILGQDPYPTKGNAHGLSFSCINSNKIPASLRNIYKCLYNYGLIPKFPKTSNLELWSKQGILLLNKALTTEIGKVGEHIKLWHKYIIILLNKISTISKPIFMLWGKLAQNMKEFIDEECIILEWKHPSPLAGNTFENCDNFIKANQILEKNNLTAIDWNVENIEMNIIEKTFCMDINTQVAFTDGSCNPNRSCPEAKAGYAIQFVLGTLKNTLIMGNIDNSKIYATSVRAEGEAIYQTMLYVNEHIKSCKTLIIVSDSDFWINMINTYIPNWVKYNTIDEHKNADLVKKLWFIYTDLTIKKKIEIKFRHVVSHGKNGWNKCDINSYEYFCYHNNNIVDHFANKARKELNPGTKTILYNDYENYNESEKKE
jgi:uracil-DNA glycosylase